MEPSARLAFEPVSAQALDAFHSLVQDAHVRRYLMDGEVFPRDWTEARIHDSQALFERRAVGLWLVRDRASSELVGFCGFLEMPAVDPEPQLVYAMFERFTGQGYATEMAQAVIAYARHHAGFTNIVAAVDTPNERSIRVLEKLGFERTGTLPGAFGETIRYRLSR
ncbi:MAG TPA: GNAT family N-acetyltransferase [Vicinamibacterales bacterium]|nr:GNAT family N-acetyltransferase [Vicinamibacterales bacterium]